MWNRRDFLLCASTATASLPLMPAWAENDRGNPKFDDQEAWITEVTNRGSVYRYRWEHGGRPVAISVRFDPNKFIHSTALRNLLENYSHRHGNYVEMAEEDPYREVFLSPVVEEVAKIARAAREDPLYMLLTFVQGLPYKRETNWQSWPTETLSYMHGDCSDTAVLYAALVEQYQAKRVSEVGSDPLWVFLRGDCRLGHLAVGIRNHPGRRYSGAHYRERGFDWFVAETTGTGWKIGGDNCLGDAEVIVPRSWS